MYWIAQKTKSLKAIHYVVKTIVFEEKNYTITELYLNKIGSDGMKYLDEILKNIHMITKLRLSGIGTIGMKYTT